MHPLIRRIVDLLSRIVYRWANAVSSSSPTAAAMLDWLVPANHGSPADAMNRQAVRQKMVRTLLSEINPQLIVETGTYRSTTTRFLSDVASCPVVSSELNPRFAQFSRWKTRRYPAVQIFMGDSRGLLESLISDPAQPDQRVFVYLDAHWEEDLPLAGELKLIGPRFKDSAIVIDDFQVPGDAGYGYDDYGVGLSLVPEYLPWFALKGWSAYVPDVPSSQETGARRGCLVLLTGSADNSRTVERARLRPLS